MTSERVHNDNAAAARERKRRQRERERQATLLFERQDWTLFLDVSTLAQKAGCQPSDLRRLVLRELVDNGLDAGARVSLLCEREPGDDSQIWWIIADDGPGLNPAEVPRLFAVNRPLISSKLKRLPLRGMLGNGLRVVAGAVAASGGELIVETRGRRLRLAIDTATGLTKVVGDELIPVGAGVRVRIRLGDRLPSYFWNDAELAQRAIAIAAHGRSYQGQSSPWWYGTKDLHRLLQHVVPATTTAGQLCAALFGNEIEDHRPARELTRLKPASC